MEYIIIGVVAAVLLGVIGYFISAYNKLVKERLKVDNQWSQIDIVLKQRNDTVPNLLNVVSGYAAHEKELFQSVTDARSRYMNAKNADESVRAAADISNGIGRLFAVAENYPELKADANFMALQEKLSALEEKAADFRQFYNDTVMRYNRLVLIFPSSLTAKIFGFKTRSFFNVDDSEKSVPEVKF